MDLKHSIPDILSEFVEVAMHNILYVRGVYPQTIFAKKTKYGAVVYKSLHPDLNEYIENVAKAAIHHMKGNHLRKIFLCLQSDTKTLEKYVFDVVKLSQNQNEAQDDGLFVNTEQSLRSFFLKLHTSNVYLDAVPEDTTFQVQMQLAEESHISFNDNNLFDDFPWMPIGELKPEMSNIVPLCDVKTSCMEIQIYIEKYQQQ